MRRKTWLLLACAAGAGVLLAWQSLRQEAGGDPSTCSASTEKFMASLAPGMPYPEVVKEIQHRKLRYEAPEPLPGYDADDTRRLYVRLRETGFLVSRREDVRVEFDSARKLARLDCMVVLSGP